MLILRAGSSAPALRAARWRTGRGASRPLLLRRAAHCRKKLVPTLIVHRSAHQDVRRKNALLVVIDLVPVVRDADHGAVEVEAAVDALRPAEGDEVGDHVGLGARADRTRGDARVTTQLDRG